MGGEGPNNLDSKQLKIMTEGEVKKSKVSLQFLHFSVKLIKRKRKDPADQRMLSLGALQTVYQGKNEDDLVLQVLGYKKLPGEEEKYRLHISDGRYSTSRTVLDPGMNHLIWEQKLEKFTMIQVKVICQKVEEKLVLILLNIQVINSGWRVNGVYGSPINTDFQELENICTRCKKLHKSD